ncbi:hypothetical protein ACFW1A_26415 [Kitasatospora sp. NPDC058965]|uniref:hypothetical protein n=1 Tax=Kitasatospora sp. NPDC058965 TaxID=3346682 RepID=UPI003673DC59
MLMTFVRRAGQLVLAGGMVAAATIPAQAAPAGGINPCVVLAICIEIDTPGSSGSPGGGGSTGGSGGGTPVPCTWNGVNYPCWDPDRGYFDQSTTDNMGGCYYMPMVPQPDANDPVWQTGSGTAYLVQCVDPNGNFSGVATKALAKVPFVGGAPPTPDVLAQMAIAKLQFARPIAHVDPKTGQTLVGTDAWLWYENPAGAEATNVGPQTKSSPMIAGLQANATATLDHVDWDLGYTDGGQEKVVSCKAPGVAYAPGLAKNPPAGSCVVQFGKLSPADGAAPTGGPQPTGSAMPGGGYWVTATEVWNITTSMTGAAPTDPPPWPPLTFRVAGAPVQVQVNSLQVVN